MDSEFLESLLQQAMFTEITYRGGSNGYLSGDVFTMGGMKER